MDKIVPTIEAPRPMSPWVPMTNAKDKKVIGKLLEELGEAVAAASRAFIQGIEGNDPTTGKSNRQALEEELADVKAMWELTIRHFNLSTMPGRTLRKLREKAEWVEMDAPNG